MKRLVCLVSTMFVACAVLSEPRSWSFVQSVGGVSVGEPTQSNGAWFLPVDADVSGLREISTKPTVMLSGVACHSVEAAIENESIFIVVSTTIAGEGRGAQCPLATLGHLHAGVYAVFYRGPNERPTYLRQIRIG